MLDAKFLADMITATRGLLGMVMIGLGFAQGAEVLRVVGILMLLGWTGDFVDGKIAKLSRNPRHTWLGDSDIYIDLFVSMCLGVYLIGAGFVGTIFGFCYIFFWIIILWRFGLDKNLLMLIQAPIYLYFILTILRFHPELGSALIFWVLAATAINWRRFTRDIVPNFVNGLISTWRRPRT